jgi:hypothetical protein
MIATCGAILLVAPVCIENGARVGVIVETVMYRWGLVVFLCPSWFRMNRGLLFLSRGVHGWLGLGIVSS